jgi:integrase
MRGIKRIHGSAQHQAKPLLRDDLLLVLDAMGEGLKAIRDRALLLVGFAGALRRSELVGLYVADVEPVRQGVIIHLRRSKTDQEGQGQKIGIPFGRSRWCPVAALDAWMTASAISEGPVFRPVDRHGRVRAGRLSREAVSTVIKQRTASAGFDPGRYSGHSLRAGFVTSAAQAGVATWKIRAQTRHASDAMLARYIRTGELFTDNAAGALL